MVEAALGDQRLIETIGAVVDRVAGALGDGHKVLLAGNGGSAGDAQHIGFTGKGGGDMAARCDLSLCAPADSTPLIQQLHITLGHIVCETGRGTAVPESCHAAAARRHRRLNEHARILPKTGRSKHVLPQQ